MFPLQLTGVAVEWATLLALVFGPGVVATLLTAPFLVAERFRALFRTLPPGDSFLPSYALLGLAGSLPYTLGVGALLVRYGDASAESAALSEAMLGLVGSLSLLYVVGVPTVAALVLPAVGYDWDPTDYGVGTWALLGGASLVYDLTIAVPLALAAFVLAIPV